MVIMDLSTVIMGLSTMMDYKLVNYDKFVTPKG